MKTRFICLLVVGWALGAMSCADDPASLLADELQDKEAATLDANVASALRSVVPGGKDGKPVLTDSKGQKGRDHRDGNDFVLKSHQGTNFSDKEIGYLYPESHNYYTDQCSFQFYFGPILLEDVRKQYENAQVNIFFYYENHYTDVYGHECVTREYVTSYHTSSYEHWRTYKRYDYHLGDYLFIPCYFCEHANCMNVCVTSSNGEQHSWKQKLDCPHQWYN